ncbi:uncharacterized protein LOC143305527 [Osmia lignaria lignaria]|uniref:uncharacterized protein LOC143305527 n=1 Tax=Osmia lignaria lignaria TaxID=1437193 RepID=UPI00402BE3B3
MAVARSPTRLDRDAMTAGEPEEAFLPSVSAGTNATVYSASLKKLPPFWKENPVLWFAQVEAAFDLARITSDETKYRHVITHLDQVVLPFVADILTQPPARGKYEAIKNKIIGTFDESPESKLRHVLRGRGLGDEKPSYYLQRIRNLAGGQISENVLRSLFLDQLPDNIRSILAISETQDLGKLALQADKIIEMQAINVAAVSSAPRAVSPHGRMAALQDQRRRRSGSREGRSPHRARSSDGLCFYHRRFAERAHRCVIPCSWTGPPPQGLPISRPSLQLQPEN